MRRARAHSRVFHGEASGFRLEAIFPADAPAVAVIAGHGLRLRLEREGGEGTPGRIPACSAAEPERVRRAGSACSPRPTAPESNSWRRRPPVVVPPLKLRVRALADGQRRRLGRGPRGDALPRSDSEPPRRALRRLPYPHRSSGGSAVPDYVHFHKIRFQMIYCRKGWTRLVYEDQGEPFLLRAGDCVLQPPEIRHRVLESSAGLEVIEEIACPGGARNPSPTTRSRLPTAMVNSASASSGGQRFLLGCRGRRHAGSPGASTASNAATPG